MPFEANSRSSTPSTGRECNEEGPSRHPKGAVDSIPYRLLVGGLGFAPAIDPAPALFDTAVFPLPAVLVFRARPSVIPAPIRTLAPIFLFPSVGFGTSLHHFSSPGSTHRACIEYNREGRICSVIQSRKRINPLLARISYRVSSRGWRCTRRE